MFELVSSPHTGYEKVFSPLCLFYLILVVSCLTEQSRENLLHLLKIWRNYINFLDQKKKKNILFVFLRDGPDQTSPQIGQFSGNTALESVYSTSNQILIKFHSDFTTSGFFVLSYHGKCDKLNFFTVYTGQWRKTRHKKISWFF